MPEAKQSEGTTEASELLAPRWAVISFERCEASGLTYPDAVRKLTELDQKQIPGLAIVTDEAASRIRR